MRTAEKLFCVFWLLSVSQTASGNVVALTAGDVVVAANRSVEVILQFKSRDAVGAMQFDLQFPSNTLSGVTIEPAEMLSRAQGGLEFMEVEPGRFRVAWASSKPVKGTGALIRVRGAASPALDKFEITPANAEAWESQTLRQLRVEAEPVTVSIPKFPSSLHSVPVWVWVAGACAVLIVLRMLTSRK
jgi:hypothetical protein